jgi:hypothetical protein
MQYAIMQARPRSPPAVPLLLPISQCSKNRQHSPRDNYVDKHRYRWKAKFEGKLNTPARGNRLGSHVALPAA